jgi:biotin operon repressor
MSYKATAWAYDLDLPSPRKFVLVALADFADENGSCFPGQQRLAKMTGLGERAVRNSLKTLEDEGLITRLARYENGHRLTDRYRLAIGIPAPDAGSIPAPHDIHTGTSRQFIPAPRAGEPSVEPSINHQGEVPAPDAGMPSPFCSRHPHGTDKPCIACKTARLNFKAWEREQNKTPVPPRYSSSEDADLRKQIVSIDELPESVRAQLHGRAAA